MPGSKKEQLRDLEKECKDLGILDIRLDSKANLRRDIEYIIDTIKESDKKYPYEVLTSLTEVSHKTLDEKLEYLKSIDNPIGLHVLSIKNIYGSITGRQASILDKEYRRVMLSTD